MFGHPRHSVPVATGKFSSCWRRWCGASSLWQDSALTGLRQALWIPLENTTFAIVKIVLLISLAASFQAVGIFASWNVPVLLLIPINLLIFKWLIPRHICATRERKQPRSRCA